MKSTKKKTKKKKLELWTINGKLQTEFCTDGDTGEEQLLIPLATKDPKVATERASLIIDAINELFE